MLITRLGVIVMQLLLLIVAAIACNLGLPATYVGMVMWDGGTLLSLWYMGSGSYHIRLVCLLGLPLPSLYTSF